MNSMSVHTKAHSEQFVLLSRYIDLGLLPLAMVCIAALTKVANTDDPGSAPLVMTTSFVFLFTLTIAFFRFALDNYPNPSQLPFMWAVLLLIEFVVSPVYDILFDLYPLDNIWFCNGMITSSLVCILFTAGTFGGLFLATKKGWAKTLPALGDPASGVESPILSYLIIAVMPIVAICAQLKVIFSSEVLTGGLAFARGEGLIGTSILIPLIRLADIGALLGSWLSLVTIKRHARKFLLLGIFSMCIAMFMPIALEQRFGVVQAILYFCLPRIALGRWLTPFRLRFMVVILPMLLFCVFISNSLSGALRQLRMNHQSIELTDLLQIEIPKDQLEGHFRHMALLGELIQKGVDLLHFGGLYEGTPIIGDMLIFVPRRLYPDKPVTTMEVVNSVSMERRFVALDRGKASVYTTSLWVQFYILGGTAGILPLAFFFSLLSLYLWSWATSKSNQAYFLVLSTGFWFIFGWLSYNVAFTTFEIPGILLGALLAKIFINVRPVKARSVEHSF